MFGRQAKTTECCFYEGETAQSKERGESQTCVDDDSRLCDGGGNIVGVYNKNGVKLVSYEYNAWGICYEQYYNGGANTSVVKNPYTYRGYYYDSDLELYYLESRYYDPVTCRFINQNVRSLLIMKKIKQLKLMH